MEPFIGQVMMFGGNFAPRSWAFCEGQLLAISSHSALFSILGTIYGGDGRSTFALPDLRGRVAIQPGNGPGLPSHSLGQRGGNADTTLVTSNLPATQASWPTPNTEANSPDPSNSSPGTPTGDGIIYKADSNTTTKPGSIVGAQNRSFSNQDPYIAVNYIIALQGIYPSRN
ncbi:MAG: microcystin-dependent protein [Saprospiraceae bacterium]|jgi:microcystin-dependent protein|tara:strand:- start:3057 stop:3569 length:513 start_codon:yes stop_codon:yes gene_type:complete